MSLNYQARRSLNYVRYDHGQNHQYLDRNPKQQRLQNKQSGFFAKVDIAAGTLIEEDNITFTATTFLDNPDIESIINHGKNAHTSKRTWWLNNVEEKKKHPNSTSLFEEYAMPLYSHRSEQYNGKDFEKIGFFRYLSLFRHRCIPNAHFNYNPEHRVKRAGIHTTHLIRAGEEVTITYLPASSYDDHMFPDALEVLQRTFGRTCTCPVHNTALQASKTNFVHKRTHRLNLQNEAFTSYPHRLHAINCILQIYEQYNVCDIRYLRMLEEAIATACSNGDKARAAVFAFFAKQLYAKIESPGGLYGVAIRKIHRFKNSPGCHPKYKSGGQWASSPMQIPRSLIGSSSIITPAMKSWLWLRGPWVILAQGSAQYQQLTGLDKLPFPSFESDEVVPFDIDARLGPWEEIYPRWLHGGAFHPPERE